MTSKLPSELNELNELLRQLRFRGVWDELRTLLKGEDISLGVGWLGIQRGIEKAATAKDWAVKKEKLEHFLRDVALLSQKRIYVLSSANITPSQLGAALPAGERADYFAGNAPKRPTGYPSYYLGSRKIGRAEVSSYLTTRVVRKTEEVDKQRP